MFESGRASAQTFGIDDSCFFFLLEVPARLFLTTRFLVRVLYVLYRRYLRFSEPDIIAWMFQLSYSKRGLAAVTQAVVHHAWGGGGGVGDRPAHPCICRDGARGVFTHQTGIACTKR